MQRVSLNIYKKGNDNSMNILDRLLLVLFSLSIAIISIVFILLPFDILPFFYRQSIISFITKDPITSIISIILLIISIRLLISSIYTKGLKGPRAITKETELGLINISFNTIEQLAATASKKVNGIRNINIRVAEIDNSVIIYVVISLASDINIPTTIAELQRLIKEYIESTAGITVREVRVTVDELNNNTLKRRVD
jgi:uncharacterized alkaline shock family protein YloU